MKHRLRVRVCKTGEDEFLDFDHARGALEHMRTQIAMLYDTFHEDEPIVRENFRNRDEHLKRVIATCDSLTELNGGVFSPCMRQHYEIEVIE